MAINIENGYTELSEHIGHDVQVVRYGVENVAVECETCATILFEFDAPIPEGWTSVGTDTPQD